MSRAWKPGDVAMVQASNWTHSFLATYDGSTWRGWPMSVHEPESIRPVLVIDPEDREQVERLYDRLDLGAEDAHWPDLIGVQAALRSLIGPPKPEEPTGLGAVVREADGDYWIRTSPGLCAWALVGIEHPRLMTYADIAPVEVLSEGVTA